MGKKAQNRLVSKQLELPFAEEPSDIISHLEAERCHNKSGATVFNYCLYKTQKTKSAQEDIELQALKELSNCAYKLCF